MQHNNPHQITTIQDLKKQLDWKTISIVDENAELIANALTSLWCNPLEILKNTTTQATQVVLVSARDYQRWHYPELDSKQDICIIQMSVDSWYFKWLQEPHFHKDLLDL